MPLFAAGIEKSMKKTRLPMFPIRMQLNGRLAEKMKNDSEIKEKTRPPLHDLFGLASHRATFQSIFRKFYPSAKL